MIILGMGFGLEEGTRERMERTGIVFGWVKQDGRLRILRAGCNRCGFYRSTEVPLDTPSGRVEEAALADLKEACTEANCGHLIAFLAERRR